MRNREKDFFNNVWRQMLTGLNLVIILLLLCCTRETNIMYAKYTSIKKKPETTQSCFIPVQQVISNLQCLHN